MCDKRLIGLGIYNHFLNPISINYVVEAIFDSNNYMLIGGFKAYE